MSKKMDGDGLDSLMSAVNPLTLEVKDTRKHIDASVDRLERGWEAQLARLHLSIETKNDEAISGLREEVNTTIKNDIVREVTEKTEGNLRNIEKDLHSQYRTLRDEMDMLRMQLAEARSETKHVSEIAGGPYSPETRVDVVSSK